MATEQRWLTDEEIEAVWKILVIECDAEIAFGDDFRAVMRRETTWGHEYRFQGSLGFGGKFHTHPHHGWWVSLYREDVTPERAAQVTTANRLLTEMRRAVKP